MQSRFIIGAALASTALGGALTSSAQASPDKVQARVKHGTLLIRGSQRDDQIALRLAPGDPGTLQVDVGDNGSADFSFATKSLGITRIVVATRRGDDRVRIDESGGAFTTVFPTTINGGSGNDTIIGGSGDETLNGGSGDDFVDGNRGADTSDLGSGDDVFQWDPGDGSDVVNGGDGTDEMLFNGANVAEQFDIAAVGDRVHFTRNIGTITMDLGSVEKIDLNALGGADGLTVHDLTGTGTTQVDANLAAQGGGGDGAADRVTVEGTRDADNVTVTGSAGNVHVSGLAATVDITGAEATQDALAVEGLDGDDAIVASGLSADAIRYSADGGVGNDVLVGGAGDDTLSGGPGDDVLNGGPGADTLDGGPGSNVVIQ